ncbi:MAG: SIMPL domain-containing protein [Chthoniobacterales bacterium]
MKTLLFVILSFPTLLFAQGGLPTQPYLYVEGKGEIEKPADLVTLRFNLVTRNVDQAKANQEMQSKASNIFAMLNERKIAKDDVIAGDIRSEPRFEQEPNRPADQGKVVGYIVTRTFAAKVRDLTIFPKLVDELMALEGVEFSGIEAGLAKEKETQDDIWDSALTDARTRAEKTLKPLEMKIASVFAVSPVSFPEISRRIFGSSQVYANAAYGAAPRMQNKSASEYRLPPVTVSQSIHVIFLISPAR